MVNTIKLRFINKKRLIYLEMLFFLISRHVLFRLSVILLSSTAVFIKYYQIWTELAELFVIYKSSLVKQY